MTWIFFFRGSKIGVFIYFVGSLEGKRGEEKKEVEEVLKTFANPSGPLIAITLEGSPRGEAYLLFFPGQGWRGWKKNTTTQKGGAIQLRLLHPCGRPTFAQRRRNFGG